mmetsp:Transcript_31563/g.57880  ORF Transcript_31563/g.57880 Transcript_31563/m.57880 type:complete len:292 (+) Transcript_31563:75-950(+)
MAESSAEEAGTSVTLTTLAGNVVLEMCPAPAKISDVKAAVEASIDVPPAFQRIMTGDRLLDDTDDVDEGCTDLTFIVDETPLFFWNIASNPDTGLLSGSGGDVWYSDEQYDYVNVITQEPIRRGFHYFEFVMHKIGDEQWCGVTLSKERAGHLGGSVPGWFYYSGRRYADKGAFAVMQERNQVKVFEHVRDGDVIGLILDADEGRIVFTLNGRLQGAGAIPKEPMYLTTSLDREHDRVELRKPPVEDSPLDLAAIRNLALDAPLPESKRPEEHETHDDALSTGSFDRDESD